MFRGKSILIIFKFLIFEKVAEVVSKTNMHSIENIPRLYSKSDLKNTKNSLIKLKSVSVYPSGIVNIVEMYKLIKSLNKYTKKNIECGINIPIPAQNIFLK